MNTKFIPSVILLLVIITIGYTQLNKISSLPMISLTTISGEEIELAKLLGKPVIVTFWATSCPSCIKEIPHLIELYQQFHDSKGLEIIAIAMSYDPPNRVVSMSKTKQLPYHVALDINTHHALAFGDIQWTPSTFLFSPSGDVAMQKTGIFDMEIMKQHLNSY